MAHDGQFDRKSTAFVRSSARGPPTGTLPQRYVCHTWLRMSCQTPVIRRGSEAQPRGKGDALLAAGDLRPV